MKQEILEEVWRNRDEFARRHNYDLDSIVAELREIERQQGKVVVDREKESSQEGVPQTHGA